MNELPLSSKYRTNASDPVDDDERTDLADRLAAEFTAGRMSQDDYLARLDVVYRAGTLGQLAGIVESLPPRATHDVPAIIEHGGAPGVVNETSRNVVPLVAGAMSALLLVGGLIILLLAFLIF